MHTIEGPPYTHYRYTAACPCCSKENHLGKTLQGLRAPISHSLFEFRQPIRPHNTRNLFLCFLLNVWMKNHHKHEAKECIVYGIRPGVVCGRMEERPVSTPQGSQQSMNVSKRTHHTSNPFLRLIRRTRIFLITLQHCRREGRNSSSRNLSPTQLTVSPLIRGAQVVK